MRTACFFMQFLLFLEQSFATSCPPVFPASLPVQQFLDSYQYHYQDICIGEEIYPIGGNACDQRFELIRPILDAFQEPFSVLDLGACDGYFSFRIARNYPAICHMIEGEVHQKKGKLHQLCLMNQDLPCVFMKEKINLTSLKYLQEKERFDLVIAFLVVHQLAGQKHPERISFLDDAKKYIAILLEMGNYVLIETSTDVRPQLDRYVEELCSEKNGLYLGELCRYKTDYDQGAKGRFFLFQSQNPRPSSGLIQQEVFKKLQGQFIAPCLASSSIDR